MIARILTFGLLICFCLVARVDAQFPQPSEEHKQVTKGVGEWTFTGKMLMAQGQQEFKGEEKVVAIGKFWTVSHYSSDFFGGMKGSATMGYDPQSKKYVGTWVDSLMPAPTRMKGSYDEATTTMTYETVGVGMDGKPMPGKIIIKYNDDNSHTFTMMHKDPTGQTDKLVKTMELEYTRKKTENGGK